MDNESNIGATSAGSFHKRIQARRGGLITVFDDFSATTEADHFVRAIRLEARNLTEKIDVAFPIVTRQRRYDALLQEMMRNNQNGHVDFGK